MTGTAGQSPHLRLVPPVPDPGAKPCHVPGCGEPARLYAAGWLCERHKPQAAGSLTGGGAA